MTSVLTRDQGAAALGPDDRPPRHVAPPPTSETMRILAAGLLLLAAAAPLARLFVGPGWVRPVIAAVVLPLGLAWGARRLGAGPVGALVASGAGWFLFTSVALLGDTLVLGVLPTLDTPRELVDLWARGVELVRVRPAPVFGEAGIILLTVTGVWAVAHVVEALCVQLRAPLRAALVATLLWAVPLTILPTRGAAWPWAAAILVAGAVAALLAGGDELARWGRWVGTSRSAPLLRAGWPIALAAIVLGALLGGLVPGAGERALLSVRGGGTTFTENPIVGIRGRLVNQSDRPVMRVRTSQPAYLRITALDVYSDREEWTSAGVRGTRVGGDLQPEVPIRYGAEVEMDVHAEDGLDGALLVPAPYQPVRVGGPAAAGFQYDQTSATLTLDRGTTLTSGDEYRIEAVIPDPPPEVLSDPSLAVTGGPYTQLPEVPDEVRELARQIVDDAGASTPMEQAFAIQDELRTWSYSLAPPPGHSSHAMVDFISNRVGYCEQYAGTMAVMLRTLDVPSRVAVGYTPGTLVDPEAGEYLVTQANAHAWVEVLVPQIGWIAFEPTPRSDDNVLVPNTTNVAPSQLEADLLAQDVPDLEDPLDNLVPDFDPLPRDSTDGLDLPGEDPGGGQAAGGRPRILTGLAVVLLAAIAGAVTLVARGGTRAGTHVPAGRILAARDRVRRAGTAVGRAAGRSETDREYLGRLGGRGNADSATLAAAAEQAAFARTVPVEAAAAADAAADRMVAALLGQLRGAQRLTARARLAGAELAAALPRRRRDR